MRRFVLTLVLILGVAACSDPATTTIVATVTDTADEADGLPPGAALAGAELRLYVGNDVVFETMLDADGRAVVSVEPGRYTVQVDLPIAGGGCFWGETLFDVDFPADRVEVVAWHICPG